MVKINGNFQKLPGSYLFSEVARRKNEYTAKNPGVSLISMGIGDVTRPLFPAVIEAMQRATGEMSRAETFRGYAPEQGYDFLREIIAEKDFRDYGAGITADEIFVSDGAKSDCANIVDIFGNDNTVAVCDPVYPVYVDSNAMAGRAGDYENGRWSRLIYLPCGPENDYVPELPTEIPDIIYLCYPNNPTGAAATYDQLKRWVDYANDKASVILFDAAYEAFIHTPGIPHSIFEIPGAETCAIEFRSFSKTAGFTGNRCAYTAVPKALVRQGVSLRDMWNRRQTTKFNGVPYIVQRGAEAVYSPEGREQMAETIAYYMENAKSITAALASAGLSFCGGVDSPYVWIKLPGELGSWDAFQLLLEKAYVVTTPGAGFGRCGEGFLRVTSFGGHEATAAAMDRLCTALG